MQRYLSVAVRVEVAVERLGLGVAQLEPDPLERGRELAYLDLLQDGVI